MKRYEKIQKMNGIEMARFFEGKLAVSDEVCKECRFRVNGACPCDTAGECLIPTANEVAEWLFAELDDDNSIGLYANGELVAKGVPDDQR